MIEKIKKERKRVSEEVRRQIAGYIAASFGLIAGLAWNEAVKSLIEYFFPMNKDTLWAKFSYAILITLVLVVISIYLTRLFKGDEEKDPDKK